MAIFCTLRVFVRNLLRKNRRRNIFSHFILLQMFDLEFKRSLNCKPAFGNKTDKENTTFSSKRKPYLIRYTTTKLGANKSTESDIIPREYISQSCNYDEHLFETFRFYTPLNQNRSFSSYSEIF